MKTYLVHVDVPQENDWENIEVESMEVEAFNCDEAKRIATIVAEGLYEDCYVWEVTEDDVIN